jgi:hypothetical protein
MWAGRCAAAHRGWPPCTRDANPRESGGWSPLARSPTPTDPATCLPGGTTPRSPRMWAGRCAAAHLGWPPCTRDTNPRESGGWSPLARSPTPTDPATCLPGDDPPDPRMRVDTLHKRHQPPRERWVVTACTLAQPETPVSGQLLAGSPNSVGASGRVIPCTVANSAGPAGRSPCTGHPNRGGGRRSLLAWFAWSPKPRGPGGRSLLRGWPAPRGPAGGHPCTLACLSPVPG